MAMIIIITRFQSVNCDSRSEKILPGVLFILLTQNKMCTYFLVTFSHDKRIITRWTREKVDIFLFCDFWISLCIIKHRTDLCSITILETILARATQYNVVDIVSIVMLVAGSLITQQCYVGRKRVKSWTIR